MSELEIIHAALRQTARRRQLLKAWEGFWQGFVVGAALWLCSLTLYKLMPLPGLFLAIIAGVSLALVLGGCIAGGWRKASVLQTARWVDERQRLQERLSTAIELAPRRDTDEWRELLLTDAAKHAQQYDPRRALPWALPRLARWTALLLAVAAGLGFVPEYRSKAHQEKQRQAEVLRDAGRQLTELTRRELEARTPALETTRQSLEQVKELGQELAKARLDRAPALRELASATERIKEQLRELGRNPALRRLDPNLSGQPSNPANTPEGLRKQIDSLQEQLGKTTGKADALNQLQQDLKNLQQAAAGLSSSDAAAAQVAKEQIAKALNDLARKAEELGLDLTGLESAMEALQKSQIDQLLKDLDLAGIDLEKMAQMAKALKDLQAQLSELGKNLSEQLERGQALLAYATLQRMIRDLQSAGVTREQLQPLLAEVEKAVEPGKFYGQVGELLQQAVRELRQGANPEAAQSLAAAAEELKRLMEQLGDCQGLSAALAGLQQAQMCVGNSMFWGMCRSLRPGFRPGGRPGRGVGTWGDDSQWLDPEDTGLWDNSGIQRPDMDPRGLTDRGEAKLNEALTPTRVRGQIRPGGPMPSITLKGVSLKGQSQVEYQETVTAAQSDAQSALSQDQVPRAYRGTVRDYFDDLKD